jgi:7-cyano-7-deazaguanine reductase
MSMESKEVRAWWFTKRIEDFPLDELAARFRTVMELDFWKNIVILPYIGGRETVTYQSDELIALCPATGYPDLYAIKIDYQPRYVIPELKSFKFYLMEYRDIPISHEHLASKIYDDFIRAVKPVKARLILKVAIRGGITTIIERGRE